VLVNDAMQDLGILAYRQLQRELGINGGSVVNFVKEIIKRSAIDNTAEQDADIFVDGFKLEDDSTVPALVVLNTGQLLYSHKFHQAMTLRSWASMPRKSVAHDMIRIHEEENRVNGHRSSQEHVKTFFDEVICNPDSVAHNAEVYVIAIEGGTTRVLDLLADDFEKYGSRITAMAFVHSLIDDSQIKDPQIRAFLHQRTRQWNYTDLTFDPLHCTDLPPDYEGLESSPSSATPSTMNSAKYISWHEDIPKPSPLSAITTTLRRLALPLTAPKEKSANSAAVPVDWASGQAVICPTFGGGDNPVGECVFTNSSVQTAILSFFEDVAQDPEHYRNPAFTPYTKAPHPTPDNPLALSASPNADFPASSDMLNPEQAQLSAARDRFAEMHTALSACPTDRPELVRGREKLALKVQNLKVEIQDLEKKALGHGGVGAGEVQQVREENWKPQLEGHKVPFAGTLVDSELLKSAGFVGGDKGLEKEEEDKKAFL
jgi:hypothetical protein